MNSVKELNMWPVDEGVTLSPELKAKRITLVRKNFDCGHPLSHIDSYRPELEKFYSMHIPHSSHLGKYYIIYLFCFGFFLLCRLIPILAEIINIEFRDILVNTKISIIFDGASVDGDLVAILFRYMKDWKLHQKLVQLKHAECTVDNNQLNGIIMQTFANLGVSSFSIIFCTTLTI